MFRFHDCENDEKGEFVKAADQMIHENSDYWISKLKIWL